MLRRIALINVLLLAAVFSMQPIPCFASESKSGMGAVMLDLSRMRLEDVQRICEQNPQLKQCDISKKRIKGSKVQALDDGEIIITFDAEYDVLKVNYE